VAVRCYRFYRRRSSQFIHLLPSVDSSRSLWSERRVERPGRDYCARCHDRASRHLHSCWRAAWLVDRLFCSCFIPFI